MNQISRSAARVLDILEFVAARPDGASLTECAQALQLPKSSALVLLRTAGERGYIERASDERYRLNETFRTYGFGWGNHRYARLIALAKPIMESLCVSVEETVLLGAEGETHVRGLAKVVSDQVVRYDAELSRAWPFYCTAMGRTIVAHAAASRQETMLTAVERRTYSPLTVIALPDLFRIIGQVRAEGIAIVEDEFEVGGTGTAAPVMGPDGRFIAALNVGCVTSRFAAKRERIIEELREAARQISNRLAGQPDQ